MAPSLQVDQEFDAPNDNVPWNVQQNAQVLLHLKGNGIEVWQIDFAPQSHKLLLLWD